MNKLKLIVIAAFTLALLAMPGAALAKDRNHDKIPDKWEKKHHLSTTHNVAKKDPDKDGLNNRKEFKNGTNPRDADTDNDGLNDGNEVKVGDDPTDADSNNDGVDDGEETAGTIQHFDSATNTLTITKTDGSTVSGTVTDATEIKCEGGTAPTMTAASHGADDGANHDAGDDNGGTGSGTGSGTDNSGAGSHHSGDGSGDGSGGDDGDHHGGDDRGNCTTADLTDGRVVHEAELGTDANGNPTFTKVELDRV
jgi:hypothetical protein